MSAERPAIFFGCDGFTDFLAPPAAGFATLADGVGFVVERRLKGAGARTEGTFNLFTEEMRAASINVERGLRAATGRTNGRTSAVNTAGRGAVSVDDTTGTTFAANGWPALPDLLRSGPLSWSD